MDFEVKIDALPEVFGGYKLDPGGMGYILDKAVPTLEDLQFQWGLELAKKSRESQQTALKKQMAWDQQRESGDRLAREGANELDDKIDQTLSNLLQGLETFSNYPEGHDKREIADELIAEYFPSGVFPITSKTYINQQAHVRELVGQLRDNHRAELEELSLADLVDQLGGMNEEFGERLDPQTDEVTYDEVRAARAEAEQDFYHFLAAVLAEYGDDMETLNEVLEPYVEVNTRISRHMSRGGTNSRVDPESGEPVEPTDGESPRDGGSPNDGGAPNDGEAPTDGGQPTDGESTDGESTDGESTGDGESQG